MDIRRDFEQALISNEVVIPGHGRVAIPPQSDPQGRPVPRDQDFSSIKNRVRNSRTYPANATSIFSFSTAARSWSLSSS